MAIQTTTLANGLKIVSDTVDHLETAALGIWVGTGARHEDASQNGISHFLEHMAFKGTTHATALEIAERIEHVGGYLNAYTSREATAYYARVLSKDVPLALDLISDILQFSVHDPEELEKERKVILQEISETNDTPDDLVFDLFQETAFPDQPLGRSILGPTAVVKAITRETLLNYQRQNYSATNMVLSAAGKIQHEEIVSLATEKFCHLPVTNTRETSAAAYQGGLHIHAKDLEQAHIVLGFRSHSLRDPKYFASGVLSTLLGGGMSSRLFQKVREQKGLAYTVYSFNSSFTDEGLLGIYAGTDPKDVAELLPVLQKEIFTLATTLTDHEITRAKAQLKSQLLMGLENTATRCEQMATHLLNYDRTFTAAELITKIDLVNIEELANCAHDIFSSVPTLTALGPITDHQLLQDFQSTFQA